ncbi:hypothetical protein MNBD_ALPHA09-1502 [hydrothermal vent metagenome]|uniref:Uncharacterized protein n=1 Tax=hydrothermal vent metagenome TaxID=652676 RepID=A0A3B0TN34_9ZZZZ
MLLQKNDSPRFVNPVQTWSTGVLAGLAGGAAEVLWIVIYQQLAGGEAANVARGVTAVVFPGLAMPTVAVPLGVAIHMGLAILLGIAVAVFVRAGLPRGAPAALEPLAVVGLLVLVWAMNFLVILPAINPAFVETVPYSVSLTSKVLFGVAAALALKLFGGPRPSDA